MQIPENAKYSDVIRLAMKSKDNPTKEPLTIREVSRKLGYSYEHIRKVVKGEPVVSPEFNEELSALLGLNPREMWQRAQREKVQRKFSGIPVELRPPSDDFFQQIWPKLTAEDIETLKRIAEGMVLSSRAKESSAKRLAAR